MLPTRRLKFILVSTDKTTGSAKSAFDTFPAMIDNPVMAVSIGVALSRIEQYGFTGKRQ
jgi:hypothetical protein